MSFDKIPAELKALKQWIVWKYEDIGATKPTKVPYNAHTGNKASVDNPNDWTDFNSAYNCVKWGFSGIGFVLVAGSGYTIIDLDFTDNATFLTHQKLIFNKFDSYSEISPSGKGCHIIVRGSVPSGRRRDCVEVYSELRYFTFTGDVCNDKPIEARQELLDVLWHEMGKGKVAQSIYAGNPNESMSDAEVIQSCLSAVNGEKFRALIEGQWANSYPSQSEADLAFFNFVAFYTQSRNQIARLFLCSPLGQREKAKRHAYIDYNTNKAFDQLLPPVDIEGLQNGLEEAIARRKVAPALVSVPVLNDNPYTLPPGLLGEIADFIYMSSPRPVPEIALAGAIALMAGICGRCYQVNGGGLNQYILLLAPTGRGKEAMAGGISKLMTMCAKTDPIIPAARQFIGPAEIASGQALLKYLSKVSPCFVSILGEFGVRLQQLTSDRCSANDYTLKRILLDLYHKSDKDKPLEPMIYSDKANNTEEVISPAVTLLAESTPEEFYRAISTSQIASGFLPRFTTIEYTGKRVDLNEDASFAEPSEGLKTRFKNLVAHCLSLNFAKAGVITYVNVIYDAEATIYLRAFNKFCDDEINNTTSDIVVNLWNRAHIKALRLAACIAVGVNPFNPVITMEHATWARKLVEFDTRKLLARFDAGEIGLDSEESKQVNQVKRVIVDYLTRPYEDAAKYDAVPNLHQARIVSYVYISKRLSANSAFRHDRLGATNALKRSIAHLIEADIIREVGKNDMQTKYGTTARAFIVSSPSRLGL